MKRCTECRARDDVVKVIHVVDRSMPEEGIIEIVACADCAEDTIEGSPHLAVQSATLLPEG